MREITREELVFLDTVLVSDRVGELYTNLSNWKNAKTEQEKQQFQQEIVEIITDLKTLGFQVVEEDGKIALERKNF